MVATPKRPVAVWRHPRERVWIRVLEILDQVGRKRRELAKPLLLPRGHERPNPIVIGNGRPGRGEREAAARTFDASTDGPRGRRAASHAPGRAEPGQRAKTRAAERRATRSTRDAPPRENEVEHARTLRPQTCSARAVLGPKVR